MPGYAYPPSSLPPSPLPSQSPSTPCPAGLGCCFPTPTGDLGTGVDLLLTQSEGQWQGVGTCDHKALLFGVPGEPRNTAKLRCASISVVSFEVRDRNSKKPEASEKYVNHRKRICFFLVAPCPDASLNLKQSRPQRPPQPPPTTARLTAGSKARGIRTDQGFASAVLTGWMGSSYFHLIISWPVLGYT